MPQHGQQQSLPLLQPMDVDNALDVPGQPTPQTFDLARCKQYETKCSRRVQSHVFKKFMNCATSNNCKCYVYVWQGVYCKKCDHRLYTAIEEFRCSRKYAAAKEGHACIEQPRCWAQLNHTMRPPIDLD